MEEGRRR